MLYVLAEERLGRSSTVMTSNRPPDDWYATFPDPVVGGAILDRLVSSAIKILTTAGRSYRREVMGAVPHGTSGRRASERAEQIDRIAVKRPDTPPTKP